VVLLTNTQKLRDVILKSGLSITFISKKLGISREAFYKKMLNVTEFKASEIENLMKILRLSTIKRDEIFFHQNSEYKSLIV
jgi:hypothetical protein